MARILVADDSADVRNLLSTLLTERGHNVAVAPDGAVALSLMGRQAPDLLMLDVIMPNVDGYGVLREMKNSGLLQDVKVLVLSAKTSEADIVKGYKLGADQYLTKPFGAQELLDAVEQMLETRKVDLKGKSQDELEKAQLLSRLESLFSDL